MATTPYNARVAISTTGTAVVLKGTAALEVDWACISAPFMNKGAIFIGDSNVTGAGSTPASTDGYMLMPGKERKLGPCDLHQVYIEGKEDDCVYWIASAGYTYTATT